MYNFPTLIKKIRNSSGLTQDEFSEVLGVSKVLISMVETGQKSVSKKFLQKLAEIMHVHPSSITPFLFTDHNNIHDASVFEDKLMQWGERFQDYLIKDRAHLIKEYYEQL